MEKHIGNGEKIYDDFCKLLPTIKRSCPRTYHLELFSRLMEANQKRLLWREMLKEYLTNFEDTEIVLASGVVYTLGKEMTPLLPHTPEVE